MKRFPALLIPLIALAQEGRIPFARGLQIVTAISKHHLGDYESIKEVKSVGREEALIGYQSDRPDGRRKIATRVIRMEDLQSARIYAMNFHGGEEGVLPKTTSLGVSRAVLTELKTKGSAEFACYGPNVQGKEYLYRGTLELVSKEPEEVSVLVNQKPVRLRTIHAKGRLKAPDGDWWSSLVGFPAEYWLLDDADNPICLRFKFGSGELDVIKISVRNQERAIEESLEREGKARIYGVHFDFASATIRPQSEPVLQEIASALRRHPEWTLRVEGHTDSIGDAEGNQALSLKRAEAVRRSLIEQFAIAPGRLGNSAGYGQTRPIDTNDTLAGRALNRRVELVRP